MRVAALLPAATDVVIALGAGDQLVAVTHACTLPPGLSGVPRVTRSRVIAASAMAVDTQVTELSAAGAPLFELDEALLIAQQPDVILTQAVCEVCAVREEDARAVATRMSPAPRVATLGGTTVDGILDDIATVALALGIPEEGEELVAGLRSRIGAVHRTLKASQAPRPRVLVLEWTDPPFSAGHWVPDMVRRAGGIELVGKAGKKSRRFHADELRNTNPELVVVAPCGYDLSAARMDAQSLVATYQVPLWALDANRLSSTPGPGIVHGIEVIARILHPQLFGPPSKRDALQIPP